MLDSACVTLSSHQDQQKLTIVTCIGYNNADTTDSHEQYGEYVVTSDVQIYYRKNIRIVI